MQGMKHTPRHKFKGFDDWIEVFRAGEHVDSQGRACAFTAADLDQMVANVDQSGVPAVLGHPEHDDPAYGWGRFERRGDVLLAKFSDVNPQFAAGVASGAYKNRSISVFKHPDKGWTVQHVGWLGAKPPAIAGLKPVEFSARADAHEFSAEVAWPASWSVGDIAASFRRLREWLIGKEGQDTADRVMPDYVITGLDRQAEQLRDAALAEQAEDTSEGDATAPINPLFNHAGASSMSFTQSDLDRAATEAAARAKAEAEAAMAAQFAAKDTELQTLRAQQRDARIGADVAQLVADGLVTPAERAALTEFMAAIDGVQPHQFSAPDGSKAAAQPPSQWFAQFLRGRRPLVRLGKPLMADDAGAGASAVDPQNPHAIAAAAQRYMAAEAAAGRSVGVDAAVQHVIAAGAA